MAARARPRAWPSGSMVPVRGSSSAPLYTSLPTRRAVSAASIRRTATPWAVHWRGAFPDVGQAAGAERAVQVPMAHGGAVDAVASDDVEHQIGAGAQGLQQAPTVGLAEPARQFVGRNPGAGVDQPDVAAGGAESDVRRFEDGNASSPFFAQMQCRRQNGEALPDQREL